jgi:diaminohydroxyphosphoribosylaminopyrimidine deaminase/5-amino-6-(5-phosphoribosylamino)uracil reductase
VSAPEPGDDDRAHLERAIELGRGGWGRVQPNPMVGCVIVRDGRRVAEGWHEVFGGPHAEIRALEEAGDAARGATAYVSLEPCRHVGKTPPCTAALLRAGIARVVYGAADPGEESGGGGDELRAAGVEVEGPVLDDVESWRENPAFHHAHRHRTPFVAVKLATSLDGRLAEAPGRRTTLTGAEALDEVHRLRAGFDGVVVGAVTARVDDPLLTVRRGIGMRKPPVRIVLDGGARLPSDAALFDDVAAAPVWVFVRDDTPEAELERLEGAGAVVHPVPAGSGSEGVDLAAVLSVAWDAGVRSLLCEGGGRLAAAFLRGGRARRLYLFLAPRILGDDGVPAYPGLAVTEAAAGWIPAAEPRRLGGDVLLVWDRPEEAGRHARPEEE